MYTPLDFNGDAVKINDRARILCPDNLAFYDKIGIVTLVDERKHYIFVQMANGGGTWWRPGVVITRPKPRYLFEKISMGMQKMRMRIRR